MMREEDLFVTTQGGENNFDSDDLYTQLAAAITVRKCKVVQKKEKLKLKQIEIKHFRDQIKVDKNERKTIKKESEEVNIQRERRINFIHRFQGSRSCSDTTYYGLKNQVAFETLKKERKLQEYNSAIQKSRATWELYKEQYENFPLAKEARAVRVEITKLDIECRKIKMEMADYIHRQRLRKETAEKLFYNWGVKIAIVYSTLQKKIMEKDELIKKKSNLQKHIEDLKTGRVTIERAETPKTLPRPIQAVSPMGKKPPTLLSEFKLLQQMVGSPLSPPNNEATSSSTNRMFNWNTLLGSTNFLKRQSKVTEKTNGATRKSITNIVDISGHSTFSKMLMDSNKGKSCLPSYQPVKSLNFNNSSNLATAQNKILTLTSTAGKRKLPYETEKQNLNSKQPCKKPLINQQNKKVLEVENNKSKDKTKNMLENQVKSNINDGASNPKSINNTKETVKLDNTNNLSRIKAFMTSLTKSKSTVVPVKPRSVTQNIPKQVFEKHAGLAPTNESEKNSLPETSVTITNATQNKMLATNVQHDRQLNNQHVNLEDTTFNCDNINNQPENAMSVDTNFPPNSVPLENNTQSVSQVLSASSKGSQSQPLSDFQSPIELDEGARLDYQSPEFVFTRGSIFPPLQNSPTEARAEPVRSEYFTNVSSPEMPQRDTLPGTDGYTSMLLSPPANFVPCNNQGQVAQIPSPPTGNLGGFDFSRKTTNKTSPEKSSVGGFSLDFNSGNAKNKSASIFSFF